MRKFEDLPIGAEFDFVDEANRHLNSFFHRCRKIGETKYCAIQTQLVFTIGAMRATVFHVSFA